MRYRIKYLFLTGLLLLVLLSACRTIPSVSTRNLSYRYDPQDVSYQAVQSVVFHSTDSMSTIYLRIDKALLYKVLADTESESLSLSYALHNSYSSGQWIDSGRIAITPEEIDSLPDPWFKLRVNVPSTVGEKYVFQLKLAGYPEFHHSCVVDREWLFGQQDVLLVDLSGEPLFSNIFNKDQDFRLVLSGTGIRELKVKYYHRNFDIALPPFAFDRLQAFDANPDSVFVIALDAGISQVIRLRSQGFYHLQTEDGARSGKTLFRFYEGFPQVLDAEQMMPPIRYLTASREFEAIENSKDTKLAVDHFWLSLTGSIPRARVRIRDYYSRVEEANMMFSSYQEGWKTDRGIIYIIYGAPKIVYRSDDTERWVYGESGNPASLKFTFSRIDNPYTLDDYSLNKSPTYKESWYNAIESWRR